MEKGLNTPQRHILNWLCVVRHEMLAHRKLFFTMSDKQYDTYWDYIEVTINAQLSSVGLDEIESLKLFFREDYPNSSYFEEGNSLEDIFADKEDALNFTIDIAEYLNHSIETYLHKIDKKYNTNFCPSGVRRAQFYRQSKGKITMHEWQRRYSTT